MQTETNQPLQAQQKQIQIDQDTQQQVQQQDQQQTPAQIGLCQSFRQFFRDVKPNCGQFLQISLMTFLIGAIVATCKMTQALMTGEDDNNDGKLDDNEGEFIVESKLESTQFLIAFGISKAFANLFVGIMSDIFGRKKMMILGWFLGLAIPIMVIPAKTWNLVVASNVFLGLQQGICWTLAIVYMIDYAGVKNRAFTIGINETIGYCAVAIFGKVSESMVNDDDKNYREGPYYMLLGFIIVSLLASIFTVKENRNQVLKEHEQITLKTQKQIQSKQQQDNNNIQQQDNNVVVLAQENDLELQDKQPKNQIENDQNQENQQDENKKLLSKEFATAKLVWPDQTENKYSVFRLVFVFSSFLNTNLICCNLVGLLINFLTAFAWGIFTKWMKTYGGDNWDTYSKETTANVVLLYAIPKGVCQFFFGFFSDRYGRKKFVTVGLSVCIVSLIWLALWGKYAEDKDTLLVMFYIGAFLLGFGTSIMYPNVLAASTENTLPITRASALGTYRFWRDSGYWVGGLFLGAVADFANIPLAIGLTTIFTFLVLCVWVLFYNDDNRSVNKINKNGGENTNEKVSERSD